MSRGQCSLNTDNRSRKSSKVKFPLPSRENASQMRFLNGFSRNSSSTVMSCGERRTVDACPWVICFGTKSGRKSLKCLKTLQTAFNLLTIERISCRPAMAYLLQNIFAGKVRAVLENVKRLSRFLSCTSNGMTDLVIFQLLFRERYNIVSHSCLTIEFWNKYFRQKFDSSLFGDVRARNWRKNAQ